MSDLHIDLNCDLGEWRFDFSRAGDRAIMPYISSCNIACGGHIGNQESMRETIELAQHYGVAIGAHPAYPDPENFGRKVVNISENELRKSLEEQILTLNALAEEAGGVLHHVKPHGALYNHAVTDRGTAEIITEVIVNINPELLVYLPPQSISKKIAEKAGLKVITEVFADRAYEDNFTLRSRALDGALLEEAEDVIAQLRAMIFNEQVLTYSGKKLPLHAETVCLHSDTPGSTRLAKIIHTFLKEKDVSITAP